MYPTLIKPIKRPKKKVLFLGYSIDKTSLIEELYKHRCEVWFTNEKISSTMGFDFVISYGYRHILPHHVINSSNAPIINLHISYLPWNRGAHPNFWSFYDSTPTGVTIHIVDQGIDTGPVLFQKEIKLSTSGTFEETYIRLNQEIEKLFIRNITKIINSEYIPIPQASGGSVHKLADLPNDFHGWKSNIAEEICRLRSKQKER